MTYGNLAGWDRILRLVLGALMLIAGWSGLVTGMWGAALEVFGWVPLVTALLGWCPVDALLGCSTRRA